MDQPPSELGDMHNWVGLVPAQSRFVHEPGAAGVTGRPNFA